MLRQHFLKKGLRAEPHFRWRGGDPSRVEGLSDAVFAFAITLLVVSLEVPTSFDAMMQTMRGFFAFAICFTLLFMIWHAHYIFFRRYGLEDTYTSILNAVLLFVVLFYIYPLKFLFTFLLGRMFGINAGIDHGTMIAGADVPELMLVYSLGFLAIFAIFSLLYLHAYRLREQLELNEIEQVATRASVQMHLIYVAVSILSAALALTGNIYLAALAGWSYALLCPAQAINGIMMGRKIERLQKQAENTNAIDTTA
ncbi:MAG: DUF1211 domain-containing protein [bacterium]|nr:DUF1211 domain-containing protein [bacterium]